MCVSIGVIHGNRASSLGVSGETRAKAFNSPRIPKIVLDIVIITFLKSLGVERYRPSGNISCLR
nr:MAG TPA: hypothetical protein [Caudoviricetes sp.]